MEQLERAKLARRIEEDLEQAISRGEIHPSGVLPPEQLLARRYGVARGTVREALLRLAARGLILLRQGRQARAVPLEYALTLESVGVALHARGGARPERLRLLEGYFELKRETAVALLVRACEHASNREFEPLLDACFMLRDGTRWDDGSKAWVVREFALLRTAAAAANRPGHLLLVQSLERAFKTMEEALRPHLMSQAVLHWANRTMDWLYDRNVEVLSRDLPPLLLACDEHVLGGLTASERTMEHSGSG